MLGYRVLIRIYFLPILLIVNISYAFAQEGNEWCQYSTEVTLTTCSDKCESNQVCAQYGSSSNIICKPSTAITSATGDCQEYTDPSCTFQCIKAYNIPTKTFLLSIKSLEDDQQATAPITKITPNLFTDSVEKIYIKGFGTQTTLKNAVKSVTFEDGVFESAQVLQLLDLQNLDLSSRPKNFFPRFISELTITNCNLTEVPEELAKLENLNILDVQMNNLETFPMVIFDIKKLTKLFLADNDITFPTFTRKQYEILRKLDLGDVDKFPKNTIESCEPNTKEERYFGTKFCVSGGTSETDDDTNTANNDTSSAKTIIIIIIALIIIILLLVVAFVWCRRRRNTKYDTSWVPEENTARPYHVGGDSSQNSGLVNVGKALGRRSSASSPPHQHNAATPQSRSTVSSGHRNSLISKVSSVSDSKYGKFLDSINSEDLQRQKKRQTHEIDRSIACLEKSELVFTRTIAKGAYGEVFLARYNRELVAVKKLLVVSESHLEAFIGELNLLATLVHPRILTLIGASWEDDYEDIWMVTEFMDGGDLLEVLRHQSRDELTWKTKGMFALHITEAVFYLHSFKPPILHRDLKSRNILYDSKKGIKLSDFGESRERTYNHTMTAGVGTARWVAPEMIMGEDYNEKADIFSLGVLLTELDTHQIPYQGMGLEESTIVNHVVTGKLRPKLTEDCPEVISRLVHQCLQHDPHHRPTAKRVIEILNQNPSFQKLHPIPARASE